MKFENELVKRIYPKKVIDKFIKKDIYLNNGKASNVNKFLMLRLFIDIAVFMIFFVLIGRHIVLALVITVLYDIALVYFRYDRKIIKRKKILEKDANLFFEILLITLKSGKNLKDAFELTIKNVDNTLSNEFKEVLEETKYGRTLHEALIDFKDRIPSSYIRNIIVNLTSTYISGKDMVYYLEKDMNLLSNKRVYDIKAYINKLPIKISVISVLILIPLMLLLILAPVMLDYFA